MWTLCYDIIYNRLEFGNPSLHPHSILPRRHPLTVIDSLEAAAAALCACHHCSVQHPDQVASPPYANPGQAVSPLCTRIRPGRRRPCSQIRSGRHHILCLTPARTLPLLARASREGAAGRPSLRLNLAPPPPCARPWPGRRRFLRRPRPGHHRACERIWPGCRRTREASNPG
jgi:hypothetical protein